MDMRERCQLAIDRLTADLQPALARATDYVRVRQMDLAFVLVLAESQLCSEMVCEEHPQAHWPHGDCPGPGMPCPHFLGAQPPAREDAADA